MYFIILGISISFMGDKYASEDIIRCKKKSLFAIHDKGLMNFCRDVLMVHHRGENENKFIYRIEEWHTSTPYDILCKRCTYQTVCLFLDTWHRTDYCITVFGKLIFYSNLKVALPHKQDPFNYIWRGNDINENKLLVSCI